MKKILLIISIISMGLFAEYLTTIIDVNVYAAPSGKSEVVNTIAKGVTVPILGKVASYYNIDIIQGANKKETSTHAGDVGFMWASRVDAIKGFVTIEGCTLRSTPKYLNNGTPKDSADDPNFVSKIKKGAKIKINFPVVIWYKVEAGYLFYTRVKVEK